MVYSNYRTNPAQGGAGFVVDSSTQREKARRAEQILAQQTAQREAWLHQNPQIRHQLAYDIAAENAAPAPVEEFATDPQIYPNGRAPSYVADRRAARFRDTHLYGPPPPLPPRISELDPETGQLLPSSPSYRRAHATLIPQADFDQGLRRPRPPAFAAARARREQRNAPLAPRRAPPPQPMFMPEDIMQHATTSEPQATLSPATLPPATSEMDSFPPLLTPSQKKRLRKKRAKQRDAQQGYPQSAPQAPYTNGQMGSLAVEPTPLPPHTQAPPHTCPAEEIVLVGRAQFRVVCELSPWPHPNQPHMMQAACLSDTLATIFIGWWSGEDNQPS
jgi:hypothetical protein